MGNFNGSSGSHYTLGVSLTQGGVNGLTRDITVNVTMSFDGSSWYVYNSNDTYGYVTINGTQHNFTVDSFGFTSGVASTITLYSKTTTVQHDGNTGAAHVDAYAYYDAGMASSGKLTTASASGSWDMTPITIYRTVTVRKGTGISDITSPGWAWTGNYKTGSVAQGSSFNINCTASTGYHWKNWSGSISTTTQNYSFTIGQQNYDITANGEPNNYTITYNANCTDSSGTMGNTGATYGSAVTLRSNTFTRTHYTFKNWNTKADGSGTSYSNGQSVSNLTATNGGTVTLYAQWTGKTYTVSYDANGGTSTPSSQAVQYPGKVTLAGAISKSNTTENGYTITYNANGGSGAPSSQTSGNRTVTWPFSKWAAGSTSGSQYSAGAGYQPSSNIKMYAIWTKNVSADSKWTCSSTKPTRTGHTFLGWSTDSGATTATYKLGTEYTITKGLTLYAVWQKNNYYFDVNGYLDGVQEVSLGSYGTVDVYVNETRVGDDVNDYYTEHPYGSTYEIKDIKPKSGYQYNGLQEGTLSGTIGNNENNTGVRINFSTIKPSNVIINGNWTSPFNINLNWSATGLNVKYVLYYKKSTDNNYTSIDCSTTTSKAFATEEETTYNFYIAATNAGGTTNSNTITITTPADQAKIRRKVDGTWVKGKAYFKEEGAWVKAKKIYIKRDGVWYINTNYDS